MDSTVEIRTTLEQVRDATHALLEPVSDDGLVTQVSPLQSPLVWDFAKIAHFEELWLLRNLNGHSPLAELHDEVYDALRHERSHRSELPRLNPEAARAYATDVHERVLEVLEHTDLDAQNALLRGGFVFGLVVQHELQHQESMLQTLQLRTGVEYPVPAEDPPDRAPTGPDEIRIEAGSFILGATDEPWAHDNELVPHEVEVGRFFIDRAPVTNGAFADFIGHKGYRSAKHWSPRDGPGASARTSPHRSIGTSGRTAGSGFASVAASPFRTTSRFSTSPGTRPTRSPAGRESGFRPRRSGSERPAGTSAGGRAATPGGASGRDSRRTSATAASPPLRPARTPLGSVLTESSS